MSYETGTASGPSDLLAKLRTFAVANGWTSTVVTGGHVLSKSTMVCGVMADATTIQMRGGTALNSGAAWNAQTNHSNATTSSNVGAGPFPTYHFYSDSESGAERLYAAIEIAAGIYRHLLICQLKKIGVWTGGTYIASTFHSVATNEITQKDSIAHNLIADSVGDNNNQLWCDADGRSNSWSLHRTTISTLNGIIGNVRISGINYNSWLVGHARYSMRSVLQPMMLFQNRPSSLRSIAGTIPNLRTVNLELYPVGFQENIGGENWDMWPATLRTDNNGSAGAGIPSSGWYGYASKRVL